VLKTKSKKQQSWSGSSSLEMNRSWKSTSYLLPLLLLQ